MSGAPIPSFRVVSLVKHPAKARVEYHFAYCGSIASALRSFSDRTANAEYSESYIQRMRVTKGRKRGSRRFEYVSGPLLRRAA